MKRKNMALLLAGRTVSKFGAGFYLIALPLYLLARTGSLSESGAFFTAAALPSVLLSPVLGVLVERFSRKAVIVGSDLLTACAYGALLLSDDLTPLLMGTMAIHVLSGAFEIGSRVAVSELVPADSLQRYNGLQAFCDNVAAIGAPVAGAAVYGWLGFRAVLLAAAAAYLLSGLQECWIEYRPKERPEAGTGAPGEGRRGPSAVAAQGREGAEPCGVAPGAGMAAQLRDGLRFVWRQRDVRGLFLTVMALNFCVANSEEVIYPGILTLKYGLSEGVYGVAMAMGVAGSLAASLLLFGRAKLDLRRRMRPLIIANSLIMAGMGGASLLMRGAPTAFCGVFLALMFLTGGMTTCVNVPLFSHFQARVPVEMQGRFFALLSFSSQLLVPLGNSAAGLLAAAVGADVAYIVNNALAIAVAALALRPQPDGE